MEIIAVANQKGGCGKTITAINLAGALCGLGKKVLFIDLDPQTHATCSFAISVADTNYSSYAIFEAFLNNEMPNFASLMKHKYANLWVIGSHISLSTMEQRMAGIKGAVMALSNILKTAGFSEFDYTIIDTPPNLGFLTFNAIHAANRVIVPLDVSSYSLNGVSQINELLELSKSMGFEIPKTYYLIALFDGRSNFAKNFLQKARERFSSHLMQTIIRSNIKLREAAQAGKVIFEYDHSSNGASDYSSLAREISPELKTESINMKAFVLEKPSLPQAFFKLHAPDARAVYVAGSFNSWSANEDSLMKRLDDGTWIKILSLPEGSYRYRFVVDGQWIEDPNNNLTETNEFGGKNSLLLVKTY